MRTLDNMHDLIIACKLVNEVIYLIGLVELAVKYIYPLLSFESEELGMVLTALLFIAWILAVAIRLIGVDTIPIFQETEELSTIVFVGGGIMGYINGFIVGSHFPGNPCSRLTSSPVSYSMKPLMLEAILG